MSDRFSGFRNSSTHLYNGYSHRPPLQRYGAGIAMVLLVHAGAIIAIKSGLEIRDLIGPVPPIIAKTIPITPPADKPIVDWMEPKLTDIALAKPQEPVLPQFETDTIVPSVNDEATLISGTTENAEPVVAMARTDPRHPLTQPGYPAQSRRLGEEGSVELLVFVLANGRVGEATVAVSSGFSRLDEAAVREALRNWRFLPNTIDGVATGSWNRIGIRFQLKN